MKIAINCSFFLPKGGGIKEYIFNLVRNISEIDKENEYIFYVLKDGLNYWQTKMGYQLTVKTIPFKSNQRIKIATLGHLFWYKEVKKEKIDVFHSPFFHLPFFIKTKKIITVHDLRFMKYPNTYGIFRYIYIKFAVPFSLRRTNHIIAISQFTKDEILDYFDIPKNKVSVIHEAIDFNRFVKGKVSIIEQENILKLNKLESQKYILTVGHVETRKNYDNLLKAYYNSKKNNKISQKLVIIGLMKNETEYFKKMVSKYNDILYMDFVDESVLLTLYENAKIFVFPSYYEGFGFPPLEAAAFGVPAVASNVSSIPEVCGKGAIYFNPFELKEISEMLEIILNKEEIYLEVKKGAIENLKRFSWRKNAKKTVEVYNNC